MDTKEAARCRLTLYVYGTVGWLMFWWAEENSGDDDAEVLIHEAAEDRWLKRMIKAL